MSTPAVTTIAGLPQYVVLKSTTNGHYLQYLWNDEFNEFYKCMGTNRVVDPVSPFVQLEVVPSTTDPTSFVHLRCSYSSKFLQLVPTNGLAAVQATADAAVENRDEDTCTLFQPVVITGTNTVKLISLRNTNGGPLWNFSNPSYAADINGVACMYNNSDVTIFEFAPWVSYEDEMVAAEKGIQELKDQVSSDAAEIQRLQDWVADQDTVIQKLGDVVAALEAAEKERKAKLAAEESKLEVEVAAIWKAFTANTTA